MTLIKPLFVLGLILASFSLFAQQTPPAAPNQQKSNPPAAAPEQKSTPQAPASGTQASGAKKPDRAAAYYHYALAHMYEEMVAMYGRSEYATKAIEEYRLAIEADPSSEFLNSGL